MYPTDRSRSRRDPGWGRGEKTTIVGRGECSPKGFAVVSFKKSKMMEGEHRPEEMKHFNNCSNQGDTDPEHQRTASSGPSVMTRSVGDGLRFIYGCVTGVITSRRFLVILSITSVICNIILGVKLQNCQAARGPSDVSSCSQDLVKEGGTAYFFSRVEADWNSSQSNCSSCGGSLVTIENTQEMEFIKKNRGPAEYWLGLQREEVRQPWKRLNGSVFDNWYPIQGEGLCAYLNDQVVSSTWCTNSRYWICKKHLHGS